MNEINSRKNWTTTELLTGIAERPASVRGTFPRFIVIADGQRDELNRKPALEKLLGSIIAAAPKVFINQGNGITIDFDNGRPL